MTKTTFMHIRCNSRLFFTLMVALTTCVACKSNAITERSTINILEKYSGTKLEKLNPDETKELLNAIQSFYPKRSYDRFTGDYWPAYLWRLNDENRRPYFLLFEESLTIIHPSAGKFRLSRIDYKGQASLETDYSLGNRNYLRRVMLQTTLRDGEDPMIVIESGQGRSDKRQFFAWIGTEFDLVRLEDISGTARRNDFSSRVRVGIVRKRPPNEYLDDFNSSDQFKNLRGLIWLSGIHPEREVGSGGGEESREDVHFWRRTLNDDKVKKRLGELTNHDDHWIREMANLALQTKE